jgi:hypothetical protein
MKTSIDEIHIITLNLPFRIKNSNFKLSALPFMLIAKKSSYRQQPLIAKKR